MTRVAGKLRKACWLAANTTHVTTKDTESTLYLRDSKSHAVFEMREDVENVCGNLRFERRTAPLLRKDAAP